ncbi:MAG: dihydroxyacetone kinase subunit DhaL [Parvibaculaceae bacterium]
MERATFRTLIEMVASKVIAHAEELTDLDRAIGDADHGINMKRGFEAVLAEIDELAGKPLPEALQKGGMLLVMKVGGASGPLYGTLFMALGKSLPPDPDRTQAAKALGEAIAAVKARGKSDAGQKTMLDVLVPLQQALAAGADGPALKAAADEAAKATVPMQAIRGRASFLGERSVGHMDPGARSSALILSAIVDALEARA